MINLCLIIGLILLCIGISYIIIKHNKPQHNNQQLEQFYASGESCPSESKWKTDDGKEIDRTLDYSKDETILFSQVKKNEIQVTNDTNNSVSLLQQPFKLDKAISGTNTRYINQTDHTYQPGATNTIVILPKNTEALKTAKGVVYKINVKDGSNDVCVGHIEIENQSNIRLKDIIKNGFCSYPENQNVPICKGLGSSAQQASAPTSGQAPGDAFDRNEYIKRSDIEGIAEIAGRCPVEDDYEPDDYVRKTEINMRACKAQPDLKDYVLKSTIPPIQKCPSCICPKVKVSAGMCKKCPEPKNNCPKPAPCDIAQCKNVVKCEPYYKQVSCPKCPAPQACPEPPKRLCPALTIEKPKIKCPAPKPCAAPTPCHDGKGRCPKQKSPKCSFKGIDTVIKDKSVEEIIEKLLNSEDPKLKELLETLKNKLNLNETDSPGQLNSLRNEVSNLRSMLTGINTGAGEDTEDETNEDPENNIEPAPTSSSSTLMELDNTYLSVNKDFVHVNNNNRDCSNGNCPYDTNLNI